MLKKYKPYIISIAIALAVGGLSALLTKDYMSVYDTINRPALAPPMWVFPVVWGILFVLMGISSAMIYQTGRTKNVFVSEAIKTYALQLIVNFFWSIIFFNLEAFLLAFFWIVILWYLIIKMINEFYRISPVAAYLQIPYLLWVSFAAYLNFAIFLLN